MKSNFSGFGFIDGLGENRDNNYFQSFQQLLITPVDFRWIQTGAKNLHLMDL